MGWVSADGMMCSLCSKDPANEGKGLAMTLTSWRQPACPCWRPALLDLAGPSCINRCPSRPRRTASTTITRSFQPHSLTLPSILGKTLPVFCFPMFIFRIIDVFSFVCRMLISWLYNFSFTVNLCGISSLHLPKPTQVSYIIMNGTTWDLEVKGVKRTKRDVRDDRQASPHVSSGHLVVPFIDTRYFPRSVRPSMRPRVSRWTGRRRMRRGNSHPRRSPTIRHMRGTARRRVLASRLVKRTHDRARLRSMRMRRGHVRPSRETVLDPELQRDFGSIVKVRRDTRWLPCR